MNTQTEAERLASEFRPTMPYKVLLLWAGDASAELRRLEAANKELLEVLRLARDRLSWFVESYPHDITQSKSAFFKPFDAVIAKHQPPKQESTS